MTAHRILYVGLAASLAATFASLALTRWGASDLVTLVHEGRREEALQRRIAVSARLNEGKAVIVDDLIAGRLTLREAAERFRELNNLVQDDADIAALAPYQVVSGEEEVWRNVCFWVEIELYHRRDPAMAQIRPRLNAQFREHFAHRPEPFAVSSPKPEQIGTPGPVGSDWSYSPGRFSSSR